MLKTIQRTGSISQDALRLGFQPTCNKGIATLLKVDDITLEECDKFKEQHKSEVEEAEATIAEKHAVEMENRFYRKMKDTYYEPIGAIVSFFYWRKINKQECRKHSARIKEVQNSELDLNNGTWRTKVLLEVKANTWEGLFKGNEVFLKEETIEHCAEIKTRAMVCKVHYTPYDKYSHRYIPDEAAEAAHEAIKIGMTNIQVAFPKVSKSVEPAPDPIIVGHVGNQMFIIAWFGYDKDNHMSCNT